MAGGDWVVPAVSVVGSGTFGAVAVEILRGRREAKVSNISVPAAAEQTISAGAKDAVEAIRTTLGELRSDLASQREKCDLLEAELESTKVELLETREDLAATRLHLAAEERRGKALKEQVAHLQAEVGSLHEPKEDR